MMGRLDWCCHVIDLVQLSLTVVSLGVDLLVCSYTNLCREHPVLAIFVADAPKEMLKIFDAAARDVVLSSFPGRHCQ